MDDKENKLKQELLQNEQTRKSKRDKARSESEFKAVEISQTIIEVDDDDWTLPSPVGGADDKSVVLSSLGEGANISAICAAYDARIKRKRPKNDLLEFRTISEAKDFFKSMSTEKVRFLCNEAGKGYGGQNFFSCGDGQLYEGSLQDIKRGLQQSIDADKNNEDARMGLAFIESKLPGFQLRPSPPTYHEPEEEEEDQKNSGFNPRPKPY